ncbi:hypothetical protein EV127DRAFT_473102 [Xylaria flabelliformis]|nr:hypothetical protein EV127DRAFT_473102 [Xylaria flabelliformis]
MLIPSILTGLLAIANAESTLNASEPVPTGTGAFDQPRIIPVKEIGCWSLPLNVEAANTAKLRFEEWGSMHRIPPASYRGQVSGNMAVWICNCKRFTHDHVVGAELNEAQTLISLHCGANSTGWVWSSKWLKSINIGPRTIFTHRKSDRIGGRPGKIPVKCPKFCVSSEDRSDDDPHHKPHNDDPNHGNRGDPNDGGDHDPEDGGDDDQDDDGSGKNASDGNDDDPDDGNDNDDDPDDGKDDDQGDDDQDKDQTG